MRATRAVVFPFRHLPRRRGFGRGRHGLRCAPAGPKGPVECRSPGVLLGACRCRVGQRCIWLDIRGGAYLVPLLTASHWTDTLVGAEAAAFPTEVALLAGVGRKDAGPDAIDGHV